eukprot:scaffold16831_cov127-Isochrysis_galbana.AAC.3
MGPYAISDGWHRSTTTTTYGRRWWLNARPCQAPGSLHASIPLRQKKALLTSGDMAGHLCPSAVRTLPLPSPILSPSRFPYSGRCKRGMASELRALQHYNSLG